ncbi:hypothetical protein R077811_00250 [Convivina intestini]|nr:hypothetical protein R077811_00250 [Convivina intestini]
MFFGTKWSFKFSYFWTSMIPAYIIFILRIFSELSDTVLKIYWPIGSQRTIFILRELQWVVLYIFTIISVISIFVLFHFIKIKRNKIKATRIIEINFNDFDKTPYKNGQSNILCVETHGFYKVNPNLIGYLLGTVFSSGTLSFSWSNSILIKILIFLLFNY